MTRTCPFENGSHREISIESLQDQILKYCTSFTGLSLTFLPLLVVSIPFADSVGQVKNA